MRVKTLIALLALILLPVSAWACPCMTIEKDGADKAKAIFTGTVIEVEEIGSRQQRTTLKIHSSEKGSDSGTLEVVSDNTRDTGCSVRFKKDLKYLVYTHEFEYLDLNTFEMVKVLHYSSACSSEEIS